MNNKKLIRELEKRRDELHAKVRAIRRKRDGVPPLSAWLQNFLESAGQIFRDYRDDVYINNLRKAIREMEAYIRKYG